MQSVGNHSAENAVMHDHVRKTILRLMEERQISHEKVVADEAGIEQSKLNRYLNGRIQEPGLAFFVSLARYFGVSLDYLVEETASRKGEAGCFTYPNQKIESVVHAMERMPEDLQDILVATSAAIASKSTGKNI